MANLLPTTERKALRAERFKRLGVCAVVGLLITLGIGSVLWLPAYFGATSRERSMQERLEALNQLIELKQGKSSDATIRDTQEGLEALSVLLGYVQPSDILNDITSTMPAGITLWQYSYTHSAEEITITIAGRATTREALLSFGDALNSSQLFSTVDIPISTLARSTDIAFTLTLKVSDTVSLRTP